MTSADPYATSVERDSVLCNALGEQSACPHANMCSFKVTADVLW